MKNKNPLTKKMVRLTIFVFMLIAGTLLNANAQSNSVAVKFHHDTKQQKAVEQPVKAQENIPATNQVQGKIATAPKLVETQIIPVDETLSREQQSKKSNQSVDAAIPAAAIADEPK